MTNKKGWGVRTLDDIPKGAFVSMYAGVVITEQEAQRVSKVFFSPRY